MRPYVRGSTGRNLLHDNTLSLLWRVKSRFIPLFLSVVLALSACAPGQPAATPIATRSPAETEAFGTAEAAATATLVAPTVAPSPTAWPYPWTDESAIMGGLCYESVEDAAGKVFVLRTAEDLAHFYDLADHSKLCRQPVGRGQFDFGDGQILAGLWSKSKGCTAHHEVQSVRRDDTARTLFIFLRLVTEGDCTYELVRPFWIGLDGLNEYDIQIVVS